MFSAIWARLFRLGMICTALLCFAVAVYTGVLARADWLRRNPTRDRLEEAIGLDPRNGYAYTLRAEYLERANRTNEAEAAWGEALNYDPRNVEAWVRFALLAEGRGAIQEAERRLLKAADLNRTWLPRWSLVNFYVRQNRTDAALLWSGLALERASEESYALHPLLDELASRPYVLDHVLPANRPVLRSYVDHLLRTKRSDGVGEAAMKLAGLIPASSADWPGTQAWLDTRAQPADDRERHVLLLAVGLLLDNQEGSSAVGLWNRMVEHGILNAGKWSAKAPVVNNDFRGLPYGQGLDWVGNDVRGIQSERLTHEGELVVRLSGRQPNDAEIWEQRVLIPEGRTQLTIESRTEELKDGNGLEWRLSDTMGRDIASLSVPPSADWTRSTASLPQEQGSQTLRLSLRCRRASGFIRAEGVARFRLVTVEAQK